MNWGFDIIIADGYSRALDTSRVLSSSNADSEAELDSAAKGHSLGVINHLSPHPYPKDHGFIPTVVKIAFKTREGTLMLLVSIILLESNGSYRAK
jgi:hypothetical protein